MPSACFNKHFLKLESCNLVNTFGRKFEAGEKTNKQTNKKTVV